MDRKIKKTRPLSYKNLAHWAIARDPPYSLSLRQEKPARAYHRPEERLWERRQASNTQKIPGVIAWRQKLAAGLVRDAMPQEGLFRTPIPAATRKAPAFPLNRAKGINISV